LPDEAVITEAELAEEPDNELKPGPDREELAIARAQVTQARAALTQAQLSLEEATLTAPFAGTVADVNIEVGQMVNSSTPVIVLTDLASYRIDLYIDETEIGQVRVGQPVVITLDAFRDRSFAGTVRRIADYVLDRERQARTVDVEVTFRDPAVFGLLLAGYSADAEIVLARHDGVLRVPTEAVQEDRRVFVVRDGRLEVREVVTGLANWRYTEIVEGLRPGELVVTSLDREGLADGVSVIVEGVGQDGS